MMTDNKDECPAEAPLTGTFPDDISIQILARTPRLSHPTLSLVSPRWRSLLRSPLLYSTRARLNLADPLLFLSLRIHNSSPLAAAAATAAAAARWFLIPTSAPNSPRTLIPIPPIPATLLGSAVVSAGSRLFVIGGSLTEIPTASVWIFDSRNFSWSEGPRMRVPREFAAAGVVDGSVYVIGGCLVDSSTKSTSWTEVLRPGAASWAPVASPVAVRERWMHGCVVLDGKIYAMADRSGVVLCPKAETWGFVPKHLDLGWRGRAALVDGVLYCYDYLGKIRGYEVGEDRWKELKGVEKELPKFLCGATLANAGGGRLVVVWEGKERGREIDVWCAEIKVGKDSHGELSGSVVWSEVVYVMPKGSSLVHCVAVEF